MNEENALELVKEAVKVVAEKTYDDLAHPVLQTAGEILSLPLKVIDAKLIPVKEWVDQKQYNYQRTLRLLGEKMANVEEEKITSPENYVAIPALQQIAYCYDSEELRNMYANLLAASMNTDTKWRVHPSYVDIIKQMTPDEAKILRVLYAIKLTPIIHVKQYMNDKKSYVDIVQNYSTLIRYCESPSGIYAYLNNLNRLGLINIDYSTHCTYDGAYDELDKQFAELKNEWESKGGELRILHGVLELTAFGQNFTKTCIEAD